MRKHTLNLKATKNTLIGFQISNAKSRRKVFGVSVKKINLIFLASMRMIKPCTKIRRITLASSFIMFWRIQWVDFSLLDIKITLGRFGCDIANTNVIPNIPIDSHSSCS